MSLAFHILKDYTHAASDADSLADRRLYIIATAWHPAPLADSTSASDACDADAAITRFAVAVTQCMLIKHIPTPFARFLSHIIVSTSVVRAE